MTRDAARVRRRWLYLPFAIAGVIVFAYFLLWRAGAEEMKNAVAEWVADQRAAGLDVSHGAVLADGFPFFLRIHVMEPDISAPGEWRWRTDRLTIDVLPYDLTRLVFSVRSEQTLEAAGYGEWTVSAKDFRASIAADKTRDWAFSAAISGATAARIEDGARASLENVVFDLAPDTADPATMILSLVAANLAVEADGRSFALDRLQTVIAATHASAIADPDLWRGAGGALLINGLIVEAAESRLSVAGRLTLDAANFPQGSLQAEIVSPAPLVHALGQTGAITPDEAENAAAALTLAAIASGGKIVAPIELKDGTAQIGGVKIADLPHAD
jgi:hypothetical protein